MPDYQCTMWPEGSWHHCCIAHDLGGTDAQLAQCVVQSTDVPLYGISVAIVMYLGLKLFRPLYFKLRSYFDEA